MKDYPDNYKLNVENDQRIALPDKNGLNFIEVKKIIRCQSDNSYTEFICLDDNDKKKSYFKIVVSKGFDYFENILADKGIFYRVHNRHIINVNYIIKYIRTNGDYLVMTDSTGEMIPVARARKKDFLNFLRLKGVLI